MSSENVIPTGHNYLEYHLWSYLETAFEIPADLAACCEYLQK